MHPIVKAIHPRRGLLQVGVPVLTVAFVAGCGAAPSAERHPATTQAAVAAPLPDQRKLSFGQTFHSKAGIDVTLSKPVPYAPSTTALTDGSFRYVRFKLTLLNRADHALTPESVIVTAWAGGDERREVVDGAKDIGRTTGAPLATGDSRALTIAFGLPKPRTVLTVRIDPSGGASRGAEVHYIGSV